MTSSVWFLRNTIVGLAHLSLNFLGFLEIFRLCLYHWRLFLKYLVLLFEALFLEETLRERTLHRRGSPHRLGGGRAPGTSRPHHLPQGQEVVRPPRQQDVRCQDSGSSVWGQFLYITLYALDWLVCFRVFWTVWERLSVCFHSSLFFRTCVYIFICFRFTWKQRGGGSLLSLVLRTKSLSRVETCIGELPSFLQFVNILELWFFLWLACAVKANISHICGHFDH